MSFGILGLAYGLFFIWPASLSADTATTSVFITLCGDAIVDPGESCDDGVNNGLYSSSIAGRHCNDSCSGFAAYCGDTSIQSGNGEQCDDGNNVDGDNCTAACLTEGINQGGGGGGGGGGIIILPQSLTRVIFHGFTAPNSQVRVFRDGSLNSLETANSFGSFTASIADLSPGTYTFGLAATDGLGRQTSMDSYTITVLQGITISVANVVLSPTISLNQSDYHLGQNIPIMGAGAPDSNLLVYLFGAQEQVYSGQLDSAGNYLFDLNAQNLPLGSYTVKNKITPPNLTTSRFSPQVSFNLLPPLPAEEEEEEEEQTEEEQEQAEQEAAETEQEERCGVANFNCDFDSDARAQINFIDISILLYNWGTPQDPLADLNDDGAVNYVDLSILLYYWSG